MSNPGPSQPDDSASSPAEAATRIRRRALGETRRWLSEPRAAVLIVLGGVVAVGGGWKLVQAWRARRLVARLREGDLTPAEIEAAAASGRAALPELFRLLVEAPSVELRAAAGRALATLWACDELVAEEEQALVRRSYEVAWHARRRYPRALRIEIPIGVTYGAGFCTDPATGKGIAPEHLQWSHRVIGSRRAALEGYSEWAPGPGRLQFAIVPGDFESHGPHHLALQTRVRTAGLTSQWQLELPAIPFSFELDPRLDICALLTHPDAAREQDLARAIRLERIGDPAEETPRFLPLNTSFALRSPPDLAVMTPLPFDLAHRIYLEFEGLPGRYAAGAAVMSGLRAPRQGEPVTTGTCRFMLNLLAALSPDAIERPGPRRLRAVLEPDPELGWTDPDIRSLWPGTLTTGWTEAEIVRR